MKSNIRKKKVRHRKNKVLITSIPVKNRKQILPELEIEGKQIKADFKRKKNFKRSNSLGEIKIDIDNLEYNIKDKIFKSSNNLNYKEDACGNKLLVTNIFKSFSENLNDNEKIVYHDSIFEKNKFIKSYFYSVIHTNVPSNYWFILSWVMGHHKISVPYVNMIINMVIILCCQIVFPISLIVAGKQDNFFQCNKIENKYNKFYVFILSLLLTQYTLKSLQAMIYSLIYYSDKLRNNNKCGYFFQIVSSIIEIIIMSFIWILTWNILITQVDGSVLEFQKNLDRLVNILALSFLIEIDDMFIPDHMQKMYENDIDDIRKELEETRIRNHKICKLYCIGNLFTIFTIFPISYSIAIAYCA